MKRVRIVFAVGLILGLIAGVVFTNRLDLDVLAQDATSTPESSQSATTGEKTAVEIIQQVSPAVVTVINEQTSQGMFGGSDEAQPVGSGTGFIIDDQGHVVTNWHVVQGGEQFQVIFANGEKREATLVGSDDVSDLAVVKIDGELPGTVPLGNSDALLPGQPVLAIGSPLGAFANTVTQGIVSATNRDFPESTGGSTQYTNLIQHDAAINPGNSGGPLFNLSGEVVGVNTLGIPTDGRGQPVQGLFFAIPSNTVSRITQEIIAEGKVTYPFFGIRYQSLNPQLAASEGLIVDYGAFVIEVTDGGPAEEAGIEDGDIVLSIAGQNIDAQTTFSEVLFSHEPGETVDVVILRDDEQQTVQLTLESREGNV